MSFFKKEDKNINKEIQKNHLDLTFIINEQNKTLKDRFKQLIKDCRFFDCLVAYFYISGFHKLYNSLETAERIRILVGIGINREVYKLMFSHYQTKEIIEKEIEEEMSDSEDKLDVEEGVRKFIEWIKQGKLQIRVYPYQKIHAKLYIITFKEGDRDIGRVITGSSNFTQSGLEDNLEFNVELKNRNDYEFAKEKFEQLWENSVDVSEKYVQTLNERTYLNQNITPYEIYLKFLYEYFKDELLLDDKVFFEYLPENFKVLEYQEQAVLNAKKILQEHGGVFISDVVGLGKTYITAMLVKQLEGRTLVIAPPALLNRNNPGSWINVFYDFNIPAKFVSIGELDKAKEEVQNREYANIIIDESHRFRNEETISYEDISKICRGKKVILVSATPYNNSPRDILAQIKLFQNPKKSTIPGIPDIERFIVSLDEKLKKIDRHKDYDKYIEMNKKIAKEIRDKILKYIMVRRTRTEIQNYFSHDLQKNNIKFPDIQDPKPFYYQLNDKEDQIFMETIEMITKDFKYSRYTPLLYLTKEITALEKQSQINMGKFMKILLVKRLESSFYAFKNSIDRFIKSYEMFIKEYQRGNVYVSRKHINKIFELLEQGDDEEIQKLIEQGKAEKYQSNEFRKDFEKDLKNDLEILKKIKSMWDEINRDPKLETLLTNLKEHPVLKNSEKIIIFTESKETAEYLVKNINKEFGEIALLFHGGSLENARDKVIENFDARAKNKKDNYKILVSTEVLSEGVNLHRSNIVINYDIPWNPTKLMQRIGRVNRIDTKFDKIYIFNFFPAKQADNEIDLTNIARSKIEAFLTLLGGDSSILMEGEPVHSYELFDKLLSKKILTQEEQEQEESELKYFKIIQDIRNNNPELFEKIKRIPKKARSAKILPTTSLINQLFKQHFNSFNPCNSLLTFFRKGKLLKFFLSNKEKTIEIDFLTAVKIFESLPNETKATINIESYYELLDKNKTAFYNSTTYEIVESGKQGGKSSYNELLRILKVIQKGANQLNEDQQKYLEKVINRLEEMALPKKTVKNVLKSLNNLGKDILKPLSVIKVLQREISPAFLKNYYSENSPINSDIINSDIISNMASEKREVILSLYLECHKY